MRRITPLTQKIYPPSNFTFVGSIQYYDSYNMSHSYPNMTTVIVYDVFPEWTYLDSGIINIILTLPVTKSVILSKLSSSSGNLEFIGGHN